MKNLSNSLVKDPGQKAQNVHSITDSILDNDSESIIRRHLRSFQDNDLDILLCDYTNESVLVTQEATYVGVDNIKSFFIELVRNFPKGKSRFELDKFEVNDDLVFIVWHGKTPNLEVSFGTDTFVIKEGKIRQQTFAGQLTFL